VCRQRRGALLAPRPGSAASGGPVRAGPAGAAVPLAAAAGPGSQAKGRQAAPRRLALEQRPALASRGSLARWCGSVAGTAQAGARRLLVPGESSMLARGVHCRNALRALRPPLAPALRAANGVRP